MLFSSEEHYTRHGYYSVGSFKTFSKYEAYLYANTKIDQIKFCFNEQVFDACDWSIEPQKDLYEMFKERATQIRSKYDYVVLMYSSGTDSATMLDAFVLNNIHLDEVCSYCTIDHDEKESCFNHEVFYEAMPIVKRLGIKHRIIDISNSVLNYFDSQDFEDMEYFMNSTLSGTISTRNFNQQTARQMVHQYDDLLKKGKSVCFVWGIEKPSIYFNNESHIFRFQDMSVNRALVSYTTKSPFFHENFFWTPDYPQIVIKQSHMAIRALQMLDPNSSLLCTIRDIPNGGPFLQYDKFKFLNYKASIKILYPKLIYNFNVDPRYKFERTFGRIFILPDKWFLESNHETTLNYSNKLKSMLNNIKNYNYFSYKQNKVFNIKTIHGKNYVIKGDSNGNKIR